MKIEQYLKTEKKGFYGILTTTLTPIRLKQFFDAVDDWSEKKDVTTGGGDSLKFWQEDMIRNKMKQSERLINLLESSEFNIAFNVGEKWFDDTIDLVKKECKEHLITCAKRLVYSKNYK
jgi:hypothetical protein